MAMMAGVDKGDIECKRLANGSWRGQIHASDNGGGTRTHRAGFPFMHARLFTAGTSLHVPGQAEDLTIGRSDDSGETWTEPAGKTFHLWMRTTAT